MSNTTFSENKCSYTLLENAVLSVPSRTPKVFVPLLLLPGDPRAQHKTVGTVRHLGQERAGEPGSQEARCHCCVDARSDSGLELRYTLKGSGGEIF